MTTLLIMTTGQTDVQLVIGDQRHKLDGNSCGKLHDAIKERSWSVVDAPSKRSRDYVKAFHIDGEEESAAPIILGIEGKSKIVRVGDAAESTGDTSSRLKRQSLIEALPDGEVKLCTPKLDAVLEEIGTTLPMSAFILETKRQNARDPHLSGQVMERRLRDRGVEQVKCVAFLTGTEQLEDLSNDVDAVVRGLVVSRLSKAIGDQVKALTKGDKVFVATTGGLAAANEVINELVHLHAVGGPIVKALEVPDGNRAQCGERAVEEKFHPAAGFRARWHALDLIEKGNLLGAWGAVRHLERVSGQEWRQVVESLGYFASSRPLPANCDIAALKDLSLAARSALRVELALRADDIPRAVHGTVAFFEAGLWDWLRRRDFMVADQAMGSLAEGFMFEAKPTGEKKDRFFFSKTGGKWRINCIKSGTEAWVNVLNKPKLTAFWNALTDDVRNLRNDVAHNEPTVELMDGAAEKMRAVQLWANQAGSDQNTFLTQPLVKDVLIELGVDNPEHLLESLLIEVRSRLRSVPEHDA